MSFEIKLIIIGLLAIVWLHYAARAISEAIARTFKKHFIKEQDDGEERSKKER